MSSIKDVAKKANVGIATVSRVINNSGFVSAETRQLVLDAIDELAYVPNELARNFQKKQTNFIGVIVPSIRQKFSTELLAQLEKDLSDLGYFLILFVSNHDVEKEIEYLEKLKSQQVVGTIITAPFISHDVSHQYRSLPIVSFDRVINDNIPCIHIDNYKASCEITNILINKSKKKLAFIGFGADPASLAQLRIQAFKDVCDANQREYEIFNPNEKQDDRFYLQTIFENTSKEFDGFFFGCDYHAQIFINIVKASSLVINKDIFIIGFDGLQDNHLYSPLLTTVVQPIQLISQALITALMKRINNEEIVDNEILVPFEICKGETS